MVKCHWGKNLAFLLYNPVKFRKVIGTKLIFRAFNRHSIKKSKPFLEVYWFSTIIFRIMVDELAHSKRETNICKRCSVVPKDADMDITCASSNIKQVGARRWVHLLEQHVLPNTMNTKSHRIIHHIILLDHTFKHLIDWQQRNTTQLWYWQN